MAESSRVKMTVLRNCEPREVFPHEKPATTDIDEMCSYVSVSARFIVEEDGKMPEEFYTRA